MIKLKYHKIKKTLWDKNLSWNWKYQDIGNYHDIENYHEIGKCHDIGKYKIKLENIMKLKYHKIKISWNLKNITKFGKYSEI